MDNRLLLSEPFQCLFKATLNDLKENQPLLIEQLCIQSGTQKYSSIKCAEQLKTLALQHVEALFESSNKKQIGEENIFENSSIKKIGVQSLAEYLTTNKVNKGEVLCKDPTNKQVAELKLSASLLNSQLF